MRRPLVAVRHARGFTPRFFEQVFSETTMHEPLFRPLARAAKALAGHDDFPPIEALAKVFDGDAPVRFVPACPRRRRGEPVDPRALYDARITLDREVPTRERSWHDLMNVLVWGTFPLAKRALHARQYRAVVERLAPGATRLPPTRTPELDALALLDEGGVLLVSSGHRDGDTMPHPQPMVFGHAIYESLVLGVAPAVVAAIPLRLENDPPCVEGGEGVAKGGPAAAPIQPVQWCSHDRAELEWGCVDAVDRALAAAIADEATLRAPTELRRVRIATAAIAPKSP